MKQKKKSQVDLNKKKIQDGLELFYEHRTFQECGLCVEYVNSRKLGLHTFATVTSDGTVYINQEKTLQPKEWAYIFAHCFLHLAFGHFYAQNMPGYEVMGKDGKMEHKVDCDLLLWNMACDIYVDNFLSEIKFGQSIHKNVSIDINTGQKDEITIYKRLMDARINPRSNAYGTAAIGTFDMIGLDAPIKEDPRHNCYAEDFTKALTASVMETVCEAAGDRYDGHCPTVIEEAREWFVSHYPLLGALASGFVLESDSDVCMANDIQIAAVNIPDHKLYCNLSARLDKDEWIFVMAHEYLHAGLQHHARCMGRNPYLWNVACDYVINGWLVEMNVGEMPEVGILYDEKLKNMSAESIYDMLIENIRQNSKLNTLRGYHKGDIIGESKSSRNNSVSVDDFCRSALQQGIEYHQSYGRGYIPAGLIEEIKALAMPPVPWDVQLAEWFDLYFSPLEKYRSYARPSRRQSCTPDIPRPRYTYHDALADGRTFGVVIDTSGSMKPENIGKALGAVASYANAHDVPCARVIFCDAQAYDAGYMSADDIAGRVEVKGRGGTRLQPGIDALQNAKDFPKDGPILIITDGAIESRLNIHRDHAFLLPRYGHLPFKPKGDVFYWT